MNEELKVRADKFTEEHFESPKTEDYLLVRLAMSIGAKFAFDQVTQLHTVSTVSERDILATENVNA